MDTIKAPSVFGWAADNKGCGYYRLGLPLGQLTEQYGMRCAASTVLFDVARDGADIIVGQRVCLAPATETWQKMANEGKRLVFEIDDDLWHIHPSNTKPYEFFEPEMLARLTDNVRAASMVTVTNETLAEVVREYNSNVVVLPNMIDSSLLEHERPRRDTVTVGWSGSFTHDQDFKMAAIPLERFFYKNPDIDMQFIGHNYASVIRKPNSLFMDWVEEVPEYQRSINFDIGIAPLKRDVFNLSKSHIKALEYAALGIPIVASKVGPYWKFIKDGETGFLVDNKSQLGWEKYLKLLTRDADLREEMGRKAKALAAEHTIQKNAVRWLQAYASLMPKESS